MSRPKAPQRMDSAPPDGQTYSFLSLETNNPIRLLYLKLDDNGKLQYTLEHADLGRDSDPKPIYNCLSYTWGYPQWASLSVETINMADEGTRSKPMKCDNQTLYITPNLKSALARLWNDMSSIDKETGKTVPMWIDSICIHQENNDERSAQVAKMDEIYRHAQKVIVWLGPEDEVYTSTSVKVLERLSKVKKENRNADIPAGLIHPDIYARLGIDPILYEEWQALGELLMRTWFSRMWVIQETFEAKDVKVYCGEHELSWTQLVEVSETLTRTGLGSELMTLLDTFTTDLDVNEDKNEVVYVGNTVNNQWLFQALRDQKKELKLETLLSYARYFGATGHHDYVYAVRGMWKPEHPHPSHEHLLSTIKPNYKLPVEDVFTAATYASIVEIGDLNILCVVEDSSLRKTREKKEDAMREVEAAKTDESKKWKIVSKNLPSWVPDWSITPIAESLCMNPRPEKGEERWRACAGLPYTTPPEPINKRLHVKGICVTTIGKVAAREPSFEVDPNSGEIFALLEFLLELLGKFPTKTGELIDAFWKTIIKDTYREEKANEEAKKAFTSFVAYRVFEIENWVEQLRVEAEAAKAEAEEDSGTEEDEDSAENPEADAEDSNSTSEELTTLKDIESLLNQISAKDTNNTIPTYHAIRKIIDDGEGNVEFAGVNEDDRFFSESFRSAYVGRRLFHTEKKGKILLGVGPESIESGDQVWVLAGVDVPIILREVEKGKESKLVGECFLFGIMNGEAVKGVGEWELRDIVLL